MKVISLGLNNVVCGKDCKILRIKNLHSRLASSVRITTCIGQNSVRQSPMRAPELLQLICSSQHHYLSE